MTEQELYEYYLELGFSSEIATLLAQENIDDFLGDDYEN